VANAEIARQCQTTTMSVRRWRARFAEAGVDAIDDWTDHWNEHAAPFTWTKTAEEILAKVWPARAALTQITKSATHH
jgi:hypothetical protein